MKLPKPEVAKEPAKIAETPEPAPVETAPIAETPAPADGATPQPAAKPGPSVVVIGPAQGRWRIGRKFGSEPITIPLADLTEDEQDRLAADPMLSFRVIDAPY